MMAVPRPLTVPLTVALLVSATASQAAEIIYTRIATASEIATIRAVTPEIMQQAEAMPPWNAWAADGNDGRVVVRIEAGAVCGSMVGCPAYVLAKGTVVWRGMLLERAEWPPSAP